MERNEFIFPKKTIRILMSQRNPLVTNVRIIQLSQKKGGEKILLQENEMFLKGSSQSDSDTNGNVTITYECCKTLLFLKCPIFNR